MTDQPFLRDRIRRAICEAHGFEWDPDWLEPDEYGEHADAVLAVLPAPADRAAEAASADMIGLCGYCGVPRESHHHGYVSTAAALAAAPGHITATDQTDEMARLRAVDAAYTALVHRAHDMKDDHLIDAIARANSETAPDLRRMADEAQQAEEAGR